MTEDVYDEILDGWEKGCNGISDGDFQSDRMNEIVNNPRHYTVGGYEALDVIRAKLTPEEWRGAMKFNILKYLMRANYKEHHDQDCEKALFYMKELSNALKNKEVKGPVSYSNEKQVRADSGEGPPF